jgi:hypothetical protein
MSKPIFGHFLQLQGVPIACTSAPVAAEAPELLNCESSRHDQSWAHLFEASFLSLVEV